MTKTHGIECHKCYALDELVWTWVYRCVTNQCIPDTKIFCGKIEMVARNPKTC